MTDELEPTDGGAIEAEPNEITETPDPQEAEQPVSARDLIQAKREAELLEEVAEKPELPQDSDDAGPVKAPGRVKVKIDGVEEERSLDDLVKHYQKSESGDRKLQQAALLAKQVETERLQLAAERQLFEAERQAPRTQEAEPAGRSDTDLDELRVQRRDALEIGDYDEFDRLDEEINRARSQASVNPEQITRAATEQVRNQLQYEAAFEQFKNDNYTLMSDDVLYNLSMSTFTTMCKESASYGEAFAKTERVMKDWIGSVAQAQGPVDTAMTDRIDKKKAIPAEPGRLNARSAPPTASKEETASEIIMNMRKARGLPV
ncbi:MAG: hypothetical protein PHT88_04730 [Candidatus Moranbacteria bacterium]|nr:hypothetical protein [Candidatus Moranbacteria bacterium]